MEKESGLELDWYLQYWVNTTQTIDYAVSGIVERANGVDVSLVRLGNTPMPQDVLVVFEDGTNQRFHIPLVMMRGHRPLRVGETLLPDWPWTHPEYKFAIPTTAGLHGPVVRVEIDPDRLIMDVQRSNNKLELETGVSRSIQRQLN
jgi:hypothetical protein